MRKLHPHIGSLHSAPSAADTDVDLPPAVRHDDVGGRRLIRRQRGGYGVVRQRSRQDDEAVNPNERSPQLGLRYKDLAVLGQLMKAGADLTQPREVVYYLHFPREDVARSLLAEVQGEGFEAEVREPLEGFAGQWSVICKRNAVVTPDFVRHTDDLFQTLADRHKGEFDGWEASV